MTDLLIMARNSNYQKGPRAPRLPKQISYAFGGLSYGVILAGLGFWAAGAGHGTFFFFSLAVFPFGIGFLLWPFVGLLLANVQDIFYRILFLLVIAARYVLIAIYILRWGPGELPHIKIAWMYSPLYILLPLTFFLGGQIVVWLLFTRGVLKTTSRKAGR